MTDHHDEAFGGLWDLGQSVADDALLFPVRRLIDRDARKAGLDMSNPRRSVARIIASGLMSTVLMPFLGPVGAMLGGLLGYAAATRSRYPDDHARTKSNVEEDAYYALKLKAVSIVIEATKEHTSKDVWGRIVDEVHETIDYVVEREEPTQSVRRVCSIMLPEVFAAIRRVDTHAYATFMAVRRAAETALAV